MTPARRLRKIYDRLFQAYGPQQWWPAMTPLEVIVGAYLTQNTSWKGVEKSIANLEARGLLSIEGLRVIPEEELRELIRPSGFMIRKAAALKSFIAFLDREYGGSLDHLASESTPTAREKLLKLSSVGPETADAILLYALGQPAMVVDEYLRRVTVRHKLLPEVAKYPEIQALALSAFSNDNKDQLVRHYNEFHALIVQVGKLHCGPKPRCEGCPLAYDLPAVSERDRENALS
jgi:endonuclease III related protein